mgnify:CR=1 FL=1
MTQDEIIEMARKAGFVVTHIGDPIGTNYTMIEAFAKLVAQEVRDRIMFGSRDDWVLAEREACAKLCEQHPDGMTMLGGAYVACAKAIRARGEQA